MFSNSKRKAQLIVVTTFLLGAFTGGLATYIVQKQQSQKSTTVTSVAAEVDQRVGLQAEQRTQVESVLQETRQQYKTVKEQTRPQYDAIRQSGRSKIRSLLNAEQQARFDQYVQELDAKRAAARQAEAAAK
ncbi:MAG: hypothetical protein HOP19_08095 [Acidobacteria bacterium]|nr:hypothetical protein [Acidobacteriota bacterium]